MKIKLFFVFGSKKLECQGKKKEVVNIDDEEESVNEELILQDGEYINNIDLNGID